MPIPILLTGETGTGKEMLARAIHRASDRADRPFLPFNCSAVPRDMLESQLFGYRKGAFTGADAPFPGVIRSAAGGTLFLDEIGDVGLDLQPKLLRFLDSHEIHPLGEPHPVTVDVRVIAATNANLEQRVAEGRFREDLLYRLNVVQLGCRRCASAGRKSRRSSSTTCGGFAAEQKKGRLAIGDERSSTCCSTPGRATSASSRTNCTAWSRSRNRTRPSRRRFCPPRSSPRAGPSPSRRTSRKSASAWISRSPAPSSSSNR